MVGGALGQRSLQDERRGASRAQANGRAVVHSCAVGGVLR